MYATNMVIALDFEAKVLQESEWCGVAIPTIPQFIVIGVELNAMMVEALQRLTRLGSIWEISSENSTSHPSQI